MSGNPPKEPRFRSPRYPGPGPGERTVANSWVWHGNELFDADDQVIARVTSDVIQLRDQRLLVEHSPGPMRFRARATTGDGRIMTLKQRSFTVSTLEGSVSGREFVLPRVSVWRKERLVLMEPWAGNVSGDGAVGGVGAGGLGGSGVSGGAGVSGGLGVSGGAGITAGAPLVDGRYHCATIRPMVSGKVEVVKGPHFELMETIAGVFLSWGCVLVDSPVRETRYN